MGTPNSFSKLTSMTSLLIVTALVGCSNGPQEGDGESTTTNVTSASYKIVVEEATVEDLIPHKVACPSQKNGKHQEQICIQVCHVPPGNPENSHDKVLPLSAIKAHLGHGDYLGLCGASTEPPDSSGGGTTDDGSDGTTDDSSTEDPSTGGGSTTDDSGGVTTEDPITEDGPTGDSISGGDSSSGGETLPDEGAQVPNFCVPYYEVDQDCDGFNDSTGMPYL